ncbi:phage tail protein [Blastochloris tepida]|uniref:Phage tail collar domain-containing protein n=1 Tax=Blastochloris tepida TaxID=2233851 RepID=A0A348FZ97_9HYPH|nr:phage tail protein [Blastochloris tepida]BBF92630.1 hypothetical protein BLTE_13150 [Blastochloris tepida]
MTAPPIPTIPDAPRESNYNVAAANYVDVGFALFGADDIEVWVNGAIVPSGWTLGTTTGADITFPTEAGRVFFDDPVTGTVSVVGARRPRGQVAFSEGTSTARARQFAYALHEATLREFYDLLGRFVRAAPGVEGQVLPAAEEGLLLGWHSGKLVNLNVAGRGALAISPFCEALVVSLNAPDFRSVIDALSSTEIADALALKSNNGHIHTAADITDFATAARAYGVPIGTTIETVGSAAPSGFLKKNGALVSRVTYAALWTFAQASSRVVSDAAWLAGDYGAFSSGDGATTFRLPDDRGLFGRGWDDGRGIDAGRALLSYQEDDFKSHTHGGVPNQTSLGVNVDGNGYNVRRTADITTSATGGSETRPKNVALLRCIKY